MAGILDFDPTNGLRAGLMGSGTSPMGGAAGLFSLSNPWAMLAMALGPSLLGGFFQGKDPAERNRQMIMRLMDPNNIQREAEQTQQNLLQGPAYNAARSDILQAGNMARSSVRNALGGSGLMRTGIGQAHMAAAAGSPGLALSRLSAELASRGYDIATQRRLGLAGNLVNAPQAPNYTANLAAGGINSLMYALMRKYGVS
jgi:hypothetical protein